MQRIESINLGGAGENRHIIFDENIKTDGAEIHLFVGPNGSGKSMILRSIKERYLNETPEENLVKRIKCENCVVVRRRGEAANFMVYVGDFDSFIIDRATKNYIEIIANIVRSIIGGPIEIRVKNKNAYYNGIFLYNCCLGIKSISRWAYPVAQEINDGDWRPGMNPYDAPMILAIDNIETGLHPEAQGRILPFLQKAFKNAQIFASTHSPYVAASATDASIWKLSPWAGAPNIEARFSASASKPRVDLSQLFDLREAGE
jgi:ABC-type lipoprotein export system ATPase subunit